MLYFTFNSKKVYVSEQEISTIQHKLAAGALWESFNDREHRVIMELARRPAISTCAGKLVRGAAKVRDAVLTELRDTPGLTGEEYMAQSKEAWNTYNAEVARIEEAKVA